MESSTRTTSSQSCQILQHVLVVSSTVSGNTLCMGKKESYNNNAENTHGEIAGKDFLAPLAVLEIMKMTLFIVGIIMITPSYCPGHACMHAYSYCKVCD